MNPSSKKAGPTLVRDVAPPIEISAEIVNDIPVKNPLGSPGPQPQKSPVAQVFQPSNRPPADSDDQELEHILQDVNSSVKKAEDSEEAKFEHLTGVRKKMAVKKAKMNEGRQSSPPIVATLAACLVAFLLAAAAFYVYRQG